MNEDILSLLENNAPSFAKGQRRIAAYITESYDKAAFMTASRLGKTVGVSESTVVRFATELGYDGYPSMQKAMQEMVLNRLTSVQRIGVTNDRIGDQDVLTTVIQADAEKLRQTNETVSREDFNAAVQAILNATKGKIGRGVSFFEKAFGKNEDEYMELLIMPETFILFRFFFEHLGYTQKWREEMSKLSDSERKELLPIIFKNDFNNIDSLTENEKFRHILSFYKNYRGDIADHNSELYKLKEQFDAIVTKN